MRVLLVNGFAPASSVGRTRYDEFRRHVLRVVKEIERQDVTPIAVIEKARHELDAFLFEMHSEFADPSHITAFDRLDFVFVAGDPSACPWAPPMRQLVLLTKMCMMTGKCFYGSGLGAGVLAFLCSTAGEHLRVLNNAGKGSRLHDVLSLAPPPPPPPLESAFTVGHSAARPTDVLLDTTSGDFFTFDTGTQTWVPRGNTGLMHHSSDHAHDYGARVNTARAGTKKTHRDGELGHALLSAKRGDTKCCGRLDGMNHAVLNGVAREFLANCKSCWDLDEQINATGTNKYRVLVDSSRGPMLIEFGNCVGAHFSLSREYAASGTLLRNFVLAKYEFLKVHEHIDRSYVAAITGSARLKERLQLATTKTALPLASARRDAWSSSSSSHARATGLATGAATMTSGRISPKRCRPVSAGPYRSPPQPVAAAGRTIQTSRSEYPSTTRMGYHDHVANDNQRENPSTRPARPYTARASVRMTTGFSVAEEPRPETESPPRADEGTAPREAFESPRQPGPAHTTKSIKAHRRIRVAQQNEIDKPYCAIDKFNALHAAERAQHKDLYYSVVNDAPYMSAEDRERLAHQQGKLKWIAGPFRSAVGKASTQVAPEVSIFARVPFDQRNVPYHIIQRRQLDPPSPPQHKRNTADPDPKRPHPASAAAASRRVQR